jgi:hypothetical protein
MRSARLGLSALCITASIACLGLAAGISAAAAAMVRPEAAAAGLGRAVPDGGSEPTMALGITSAAYGDEESSAFTATVTGNSNLGPPTGTVTVTYQGEPICTITVFEEVSAAASAFTCSPVSAAGFEAGSYPFVARYSGDENYGMATATGVLDVTRAVSTTTLKIFSYPYGAEQDIEFAGSVDLEYGDLSAPGTVTISSPSTGTLCSYPSTQTGCFPLTATELQAGSYPAAASYSGDTNYQPSAAAAGLTIGQASTTVQLTESNPGPPGTAAYGNESAVKFTATVSPEYSGTPTGTVTVDDSGNDKLCTITLTTGQDGSGSCSPGDTVLGAGSYEAIAHYSGDTNFGSSDTSGSPLSFSVSRAGSATNLSLSAASIAYGSEGTEKFTATVTPRYAAAGFPAGQVTIAESGTTLCTITLASGTGACSMPAAKLPAGKYNLTARYGGGSAIAGSASAVSKLAVAKDASATSLKLSASAVTLGHENAEHLTIQVKSPRSGAVTGKVTITAKTTGREPEQVCAITLKSGAGSCTLPAKALRPGTYLLTAAYAGNRNILTSHSPKKTLTIRK